MQLRLPLFLLLFIVFISPSVAQPIQGAVMDMASSTPVSGVHIENIYNGMVFYSDSEGKFVVTAAKGQLLEFKKTGYKSVHVRIPEGIVPPYFKIIMQQGLDMSTPVYIAGQPRKYDYTADSIRFHDIYKHELDFPRMSTLDMINHPFSALSKKSQEIWAFQDDYKATEQQKYIDSKFTPELVARLTGLEGDKLHMYMRRYRPTYSQLKSMSEYSYYNYIKHTAHQFSERSSSRNTN